MIKFKHAGKTGETVIVRHVVKESFRGRGAKILATDSGKPAGVHTRIGSIRIDGASQRQDGDHLVLTLFYANGSSGNILYWKDMKVGSVLEIEVLFLADCEWSIELEEAPEVGRHRIVVEEK